MIVNMIFNISTICDKENLVRDKLFSLTKVEWGGLVAENMCWVGGVEKFRWGDGAFLIYFQYLAIWLLHPTAHCEGQFSKPLAGERHST